MLANFLILFVFMLFMYLPDEGMGNTLPVSEMIFFSKVGLPVLLNKCVAAAKQLVAVIRQH